MSEQEKYRVIPVKKANDFVGIEINKESIDFYVPQVFRKLDSKEGKKDLLLFLKSLSIAKTIDEEQLKNSKDKGTVWPIDSYLWIIRDYLENGFYYNREKQYFNDNKGKIDWKKTMKNIPIYSNGNIIFDKLVTSRMSATNDVVAQIYKLCLKHSVNKIGWLFEYNIIVDINQNYSKKEIEYIIKKEILSTFDDVKKLRFKHMLRILENGENDNMLSNSFSYGISNYYYVFEQMVDMFFKGIQGSEKKKYNPSGHWQLNNEAPKEASSLRPDTIYKRKGETFIIDAKMYQYGVSHNTKDLPQTESLQKQITYGDFVHNFINDSKVRNAFILPYNKYLDKFVKDTNLVRFKDSNLVYIGRGYVDWRDDGSKCDHDYIYAFMIDFNFLLRNYKVDDSSYIEQLCDYIDDYIKNSKT